MNERNRGIRPLQELDDYEVAENSHDVRGWDVYGGDGAKLGEVDQLLADTEAMKVRYLDVHLDGTLVGDKAGEKRCTLIPIGLARFEPDDSRVVVDHVRTTDVSTLPAYEHQPLTREQEVIVRDRYHTGGLDAAGADFYSATIYESQHFDRMKRRD